jgi:hypothetical protein
MTRKLSSSGRLCLVVVVGLELDFVFAVLSGRGVASVASSDAGVNFWGGIRFALLRHSRGKCFLGILIKDAAG